MLGKSYIPSSLYLFSAHDFFHSQACRGQNRLYIQYLTELWVILWRALLSSLWAPLPGTPVKSG